MKIVIATPIRDRAWALPSWWKHLHDAVRSVREDGIDVSVLFLENDSVDETLATVEILQRTHPEWVRVMKHDIGYAHYRAPRGSDPVNTKNDKGELAQLRNMLVDAFLETDGNYLIMWDSDVWMPTEALSVSGHRRSLVSVMEAHPKIGTLCADVQHPHCKGKYHNGMVLNNLGQINHPDRTRPIPPKALIDVFATRGREILYPDRQPLMRWDQRAACYSERAREVLYLSEVATTGGGGAAILRREVLEEPIGARYAAHILGEDVNLCRTISNAGRKVALYSGIRGLHLSRKLFDEADEEISLGSDHENRFGVWVEDWLEGLWRKGGCHVTPTEGK